MVSWWVQLRLMPLKRLMLISDGGTLVRTRASEVAQTGRNAQGVRLIRLGNDELLVGVVSVEAVEEDELLKQWKAKKLLPLQL